MEDAAPPTPKGRVSAAKITMSHYVMVDGVLLKSNAETRRWAQRAAQAMPSDTEEKPDAVALPADKRTLFEIVESLEDHE